MTEVPTRGGDNGGPIYGIEFMWGGRIRQVEAELGVTVNTQVRRMFLSVGFGRSHGDPLRIGQGGPGDARCDGGSGWASG